MFFVENIFGPFNWIYIWNESNSSDSRISAKHKFSYLQRYVTVIQNFVPFIQHTYYS